MNMIRSRVRCRNNFFSFRVVSSRFFLFCFVLFGLVWFGLVLFGLVRFCLVLFGLIWFRLVWLVFDTGFFLFNFVGSLLVLCLVLFFCCFTFFSSVCVIFVSLLVLLFTFHTLLRAHIQMPSHFKIHLIAQRKNRRQAGSNDRSRSSASGNGFLDLDEERHN